MDALGLPYAPGHGRAGVVGLRLAGAVGLRRGPASRCPANQAELFAVTTPVAAADVLPGDLVFLGTPESGLGHVGIALDPQTMLAADARAGAVVVRTLPADQVLGIGRPEPRPAGAGAGPGPDRRGADGRVRQHRLPARATTARARGAATPTG